jgi:tetratricopeptide (TPR) repeat protein
MLHVWSGQAHAGIEELELAGHYASESGNRFELVHALSGLVSTLVYGPTPVSEALEKLEDISRQGEGALMLETRILRAKARLVAMQGDFMKARELIGQADTLAQGLGLEILRAGGILRYAGEIELLAGDHAAAERMLRSACEVLESKRDWGHFASVAPLLALGLIAQDRTDEAVTFIEAARAHTSADDVEAQILQLRGGSKLAAHRGSSAEAEALARQASVRASQNDDPDVYATTLVELADALERLGRGEEAAAALEQALQLFEQKGNLVMAERVRGRLADR